jgi:mono/diheme cytochrome c family protein
MTSMLLSSAEHKRASRRLRTSVRAGCFALVLLALPASGQTAGRVQQPSSAQDLTLTGDAARGEFLFLQRCSVCHLNLAKSGPVPGAGPSLKGVLKDASPEREAKVRTQIRIGSARMPGFQYGLTATQLEQLMAYLRVIK